MKRLLSLSGLERQRISLGYVDVNEPEKFVRMVDSFLDEADSMGPINRTEEQQMRLLAAHATLNRPRVRWVLGASLRRPSELEFPSSQRNAVAFDEVVQDVITEEYMAARIVGTLQDSSLNPPSIAKALGERPARISPLLDVLVKDRRIYCSGWEDLYPIYSVAKPA
jgi:hypothetical protein